MDEHENADQSSNCVGLKLGAGGVFQILLDETQHILVSPVSSS